MTCCADCSLVELVGRACAEECCEMSPGVGVGIVGNELIVEDAERDGSGGLEGLGSEDGHDASSNAEEKEGFCMTNTDEGFDVCVF